MEYRVRGLSERFHTIWLIPVLTLLLVRAPDVSGQDMTGHPGIDTDFPAYSSAGDGSELTLYQALQFVLQKNPELAAFSSEIRAFEGTKLQAGLFRNPEFSIEVEDINSSNSAVQRFTTFRISQLIELGGKRPARVNVATLGQELADQAYAAKRLEIIARTANAFIDVLENQAQVRVVDDTVRLSRAAMEAVARRVEAGKAPPMEEIRSKVAFSTVNIELEQARRGLAAARARLALLWGETEPQFGQALGKLESFIEIPTFEQLIKRLEKNPVILQSIKNIAQREAVVELEKARRIPDITLGAGIRRYLGVDSTTALLDMSIPIPVFNRNQGNELEARHRLNKAVDERMAVELQLRTEFIRTYENLLAARNEIGILRDEVLPGARNAFEITNRGYQLGKFSFLEMLDAQRAFFQNRILYVRALANYQRLINTIEQLVAAPLDESAMDSTGLAEEEEHN